MPLTINSVVICAPLWLGNQSLRFVVPNGFNRALSDHGKFSNFHHVLFGCQIDAKATSGCLLKKFRHVRLLPPRPRTSQSGCAATRCRYQRNLPRIQLGLYGGSYRQDDLLQREFQMLESVGKTLPWSKMTKPRRSWQADYREAAP